MIIVADASPLVALALCDCLELLDQLFGDVWVTQEVFDEVTAANKPGADKLESYLLDKISESTFDTYILGQTTLDRGELTSIILYKKLDADYLLIDEKAGRKIAKLNDVNIIGSLGVLIEAKRKGVISVLKPCIEVLRVSKVHFSEELLNYALSAVGEDLPSDT